jgi:hypothetical protein
VTAVLEKMHRSIRGQGIGTNDVIAVELRDELELKGNHQRDTFETGSEFRF